ASLGVPDEPNTLNLEATKDAVVLLIDGLGWNLLRAHAEYAPFLAGFPATTLTVGFPTTTAASIASLGVGRPSGEHGLIGYTTRLDGFAEPINWLRWQGAYSGAALPDGVTAETLQPRQTALERAEQAGVEVSVVSAYALQASGLTRAVLRGGRYVPVFTPADTVAAVAAAVRAPGPATTRRLVYCYNAELDLVGHGRGCDSDAWRVQLQLVDRMAELLAERLPSSTRLYVTGDHGMLDLPEAAKVDYDAEPELAHGVGMIAGDSRVRYLHVAEDDLDAVRSRWAARLGDRAAILTRAEVIDAGWYGPVVTDTARARIGDLVVVAVGELAVVRRKAEPRPSMLIGHHGALSDDELLVPLLRA
ncbi:MAG: alkaline phosphatase family protein, partial [Actinobacteria bacterium]|nr:alkaline phosphatase family protein [Actinomycetota bacterium]